MIYIATSSEHVDGISEDAMLRDCIEQVGHPCEIAPWDEWDVELSATDICVIRSTWNYTRTLAHFLTWCQRVSETAHLINSLDIIRWNSRKSYLSTLAASGVPVLPTRYINAGTPCDLEEVRKGFGCHQIVIKPLIGAGARGLSVYPSDLPNLRYSGTRQAKWPHDVMIQPLAPSVRTNGEWSLIYILGELQHAVQKIPAMGDIRSQPEYNSTVVRADPPVAVLNTAGAAVSAGPSSTYARIDVLQNTATSSILMEAEYIEPQLFLPEAPETALAFAKALGRIHNSRAG